MFDFLYNYGASFIAPGVPAPFHAMARQFVAACGIEYPLPNKTVRFVAFPVLVGGKPRAYSTRVPALEPEPPPPQ